METIIVIPDSPDIPDSPATLDVSISPYISSSEEGDELPYYEAHSCAICLEEFVEEEDEEADKDPSTVTLSCGHTFHFECATTVLVTALASTTDFVCPLCRNVEIHKDSPEYIQMYRHHHAKLREQRRRNYPTLSESNDDEVGDSEDYHQYIPGYRERQLQQQQSRSLIGRLRNCTCMIVFVQLARLTCFIVTFGSIVSMIISIYMLLRNRA